MTSTATARPTMAQLCFQFLSQPTDFLCLYLAPIFLTPLQTADYYIFSAENFIYVPLDTRRAPGAPAKTIKSKLESDHYACEGHALAEPVPVEESKKYANPDDLFAAVALNVERKLLMGNEHRVRDLVTGSAVPKAAVAAKWNDAGSSPMTDVAAARKNVFDNTGLEPNLITLPRGVYEALKLNAEIKSYIGLSSKDSRWPEMLAALFDVERVAVGRAIVSAQAEGQPDWSVEEVWGDSVIVAHANGEPNLRAPSFARTFLWTDATRTEEDGKEVSFESGINVEKYLSKDQLNIMVRADQHVDEHLCAPLAGFHLEDTLL